MSYTQMLSDWQVMKLGDIARIVSGGTPSRTKPEYWNGEIPWVKTGEINYGIIKNTEENITQEGLKNSSARIIPANTLLMAMYGQGITRGRVAILGIDAAINQACAAILTDDSVSTDFLFYLLTHSYEKIRNLGHGANQKNLNAALIKSIEVTLPPFPEQKAIAYTLRTIQKVKETRQRELELEREHKAALMQYLFTHGTRNEPRKQTEIGEIPESWEVVKLGDISKILSGGTPSRNKPEYWNGDIPWVKTGEINYGIITNTEEKITKEGLEKSSARIIPSGTLLMAMYGQGVTRGKVAILGINATINQACAAILVKDINIFVNYIFYFLSWSYKKIRGLGYGANQTNLNSILIKSIPVALPVFDEQKNISISLKSCDRKIQALEKEISLIDELFHAMLEDLMTGKLSTQPLIEVNV